MHIDWQQFLQKHNATIENNCVVHYGDRAAELSHTRTATIMVDLSHQSLICFSGEDAQTFLQSQLSCDVNEVHAHQAQYGSYCTAKGRMLASFLLWRENDDFLMSLPANLCPSILKRLSLFVLRAKAQLTDCSDQWIRIGLAGSDAKQIVEEISGTKWNSTQHLSVTHNSQTSIITHTQNRFELITTIENAPTLWEQMNKQAKPVGADCWDWLQIQSGIPVILPATQEQFLPQMVNLDTLGGVSFKKGCYPGQEIVARTQYLGKLKRRMFLANISTDTVVTAGDELFCTDMAEQSCGKIVNATPAPDGGYDVLAVIQKSSVEAGEVFWGSLDGPELRINALPYSLD
jgi:tRNA-modifying protein YgfZ